MCPPGGPGSPLMAAAADLAAAASQYKELAVSRSGTGDAIVTLTFNRPEQRNTWTETLRPLSGVEGRTLVFRYPLWH
jgi:1,4-dihydroxy-2-naphthoyl-CoA synthase